MEGFTTYGHATEPDIRVPYGLDGNPIAITPPAGYSVVSENPAVTGHNGAETQIDFTAGTSDVPWMNGKNLETDYKFADPRSTPNSKTVVSGQHEWRFLSVS